MKRILVDGGYYDKADGKYYFYMTDHLGNNRMVIAADGTITQGSHYYPFGATFADGDGTDKQPYKYNGKELDKMHGLNMYDYSARYMDPSIGRFTTVDPHAENYYSHSPYAYVGNNPIRITDPTGMDWYEDENGNATWHKNQTAAEYKDENDKVWKRTGDSRTVVTADNQAIVFGQKTDKDGNQTLTSKVFSFGEEAQASKKDETSAFAAALPIAATCSLADGPFLAGEVVGGAILVGAGLYTLVTEFSKTPRGNHRDDGLRDWTDADIAGALAGLAGQLTKEQKALKQKLTKEQKVRGNRNVQKKGTEKGTGTGRK